MAGEWRRPLAADILERLNQSCLEATARSFPLTRGLASNQIYVPDQSHASPVSTTATPEQWAEQLYDPAFILPLIIAALETDGDADLRLFLERGCLQYVFLFSSAAVCYPTFCRGKGRSDPTDMGSHRSRLRAAKG